MATFALLALGLGLLTLIGMLAEPSGRTEASKFGLMVEKVERETPVLDDDSERLLEMSKDSCLKYSLRRANTRYQEWKLLQRFPEKDSGLPNGFVVVASRVPPDLVSRLKPLAEEYGDDYYEFEREGDIVSAFCWNDDKKTIKKLYDTLSSLEV